MIDILKNSLNPAERQIYVEKLNEAVTHSEELISREQEYVQKLKTKISEYDIYNQTNPYPPVCELCHEAKCVCADAGIENDTISITNSSGSSQVDTGATD